MKRAILYMLESPFGKAYIGVTIRTLSARISSHCNSNHVIGKALRKYGRNNFKQRILVVGEKDYIYSIEKRAIEVFGTLAPLGYNLKEGGNVECSYTEQARAKMRAASKNRWSDPTERKRTSEATRKAMSRPEIKAKYENAFRGRKHSAETRAKIAEAGRGRKHTAEAKAKMSAAHKGREVSLETRAKMSIAGRGRRHTAETKARMSAAHKKRRIDVEADLWIEELLESSMATELWRA